MAHQGSCTVIVGCQWGDEGKGKIVDWLCKKLMDWIERRYEDLLKIRPIECLCAKMGLCPGGSNCGGDTSPVEPGIPEGPGGDPVWSTCPPAPACLCDQPPCEPDEIPEDDYYIPCEGCPDGEVPVEEEEEEPVEPESLSVEG